MYGGYGSISLVVFKVSTPDRCGAWSSSSLLQLNLAPALTSYLPVLATGGGDNKTRVELHGMMQAPTLLPLLSRQEDSLNDQLSEVNIRQYAVDLISWRQREQSRFRTVRKYTCLVCPTACSPESSDGSLIFSASASPACHSAWLDNPLSLLFLPPLALPDFLPSTTPIYLPNSQSSCS